MLVNKRLRFNKLKAMAAMDARISLFVICVKAVIYLLQYNLHDCTFKTN